MIRIAALLLSLGLVSALPVPNPAIPGAAVTHHTSHTASTSHHGGMGFGYTGGMGFGYPTSALGGYGYGAYPSLTGMGYGGYGYPASKQVTQVTTTAVRPGMFGYF